MVNSIWDFWLQTTSPLESILGLFRGIWHNTLWVDWWWTGDKDYRWPHILRSKDFNLRRLQQSVNFLPLWSIVSRKKMRVDDTATAWGDGVFFPTHHLVSWSDRCAVLRGNASEILSLSGADGASKGVDSTKGTAVGERKLEKSWVAFFYLLLSFLVGGGWTTTVINKISISTIKRTFHLIHSPGWSMKFVTFHSRHVAWEVQQPGPQTMMHQWTFLARIWWCSKSG